MQKHLSSLPALSAASVKIVGAAKASAAGTATRQGVEERELAAVLELVGKLSGESDLATACRTAVGAVASHIGCQRVAIGLCSRGARRCRLQALSGSSRFDKHSELTRAIEAALDEALLRKSFAASEAERGSSRALQHVGYDAVYPDWVCEDKCGSTLALQRLGALSESTAACSAPLFNEQGEMVGAWLALGTPDCLARPDNVRFLRLCETSLGTCLNLLRRAERGPLATLVRKLYDDRKLWQGKAILFAAILVAVFLAIPWPYKIACNCKLQPVLRRFVAAPFDGVLEKSLVAPGDLVSAGDVVARLEGREIRWELAGVTADFNRASKQCDAARAVHNVAAAQQAKLEMERLELKIRLLRDRAEHLEVKSPLDGIIVSGDLDKAEGAPLAVGQTLFEVAPLRQMLVELAVPEEDVAYVHIGAEVRVQLDAYGSERWTGAVSRLHPRSELRDDHNVFIAEVTFDNEDGRLRPGLKGNAQIIGPRRPVAWNLFHKAWERLLLCVGW